MNKAILHLILILTLLVLIIPSAKAQIAVDYFTANPEVVQPGESVNIELTLENLGEEDVEDVSVGLDLTQVPFVPVASSNEKIIDEIRDGDREGISFMIKALPDAVPGNYKIPIIIIHGGISKTSIISVEISAEAKLDVLINNADLVEVGDNGKVTLKFVNNGFSQISYLKVTLVESPFYEILSPQTLYIGEVDVGDFETEEYTIIAKQQDPSLILAMEYRDFKNNNYAVPKLVKLSVYSTLEAEQLGLNENKSTFSFVIAGIIIIILLVFFYRRRRRKKKNAN